MNTYYQIEVQRGGKWYPSDTFGGRFRTLRVARGVLSRAARFMKNSTIITGYRLIREIEQPAKVLKTVLNHP